MIDKLTKEQEEMIPVFRERFRAIGLSTDVVDLTVKDDIIELFKMNDLKEPVFVFVDNPYEAKIFATIVTKEPLYKYNPRIEKAIDDAIDFGELIPESLIDDMVQILKDTKEEIYNLSFESGANQSYWHSFYAFGQYIGVKFDDDSTKKFEIVQRIAKKCGYIFYFDNMIIVTNRPCELHFDENNEGHNEKGPYIKFRHSNGKSDLYAIHGVVVPASIIEHPELITMADIEAEENAEVKRIMMSQMGIEKYLDQTQATIVDMDMTFVSQQNDTRSVPRALMQDKDGRKFLVGSDGSNARVFYMQVPEDCMTCVQAASALAGFDESKIIAAS